MLPLGMLLTIGLFLSLAYPGYAQADSDGFPGFREHFIDNLHDKTKTIEVECTKGETIARALRKGNEDKPLVVVVRGICSENVVIDRDDVTLQGNTSGDGVTGLDPTKDTILIDGARRVVIDDLIVTGGKNGITGTRGASFAVKNSTIQNSAGTPSSNGNGIDVRQNSQALVHNNLIENHPVYGISVNGGSNATITANTIRHCRDSGIGLVQSASARIGLTEDEAEAGNLIELNRIDGIGIFDASSAVLYGNTIQNNGFEGAIVIGEGIFVGRKSSLRMLGRNTIRLNGLGIFLRDAHLRTGKGSFAITPNNEEISNNFSTGIFAEENSTLELRDGVVNVTNNSPGFGILLQHGSRARMREALISGNTAGGMVIQLASSVRFLTPLNTISGNGGFGLNCIGGESSFVGNFVGGGNGSGDVNPTCSGF
jgi:nitrous oxidase accessory protein NosD